MSEIGQRVAALYIDPRGPYPKLLGPEFCWDEVRDARTYAGPWPVVAHPPCGPWGDLAVRSKETTKDLAVDAIAQVRRWGGVLEHPKNSKLFDHVGCPRPGELPDAWGGTCWDVAQVSWGHKCRKPTRLYVVGAVRHEMVKAFRVGGEPTHQIFGSKASGHGHRTDLKAASREIRRRTPVAFAEFLVAIARAARPTA